MPRRFWLAKSEPSTYSWDDLVREGGTRWDGVRNAQARNNLAAMRKGDRVFIYHSGDGKQVVGIAEVRRAAYPDPSSDDPRWLVVDLAPVKPLAKPVRLADIKADASLSKIPLLKQSRLSVMPLEKSAFDRILELAAARA
jgi:predicted RNA-binding protein with PUA-like domain